MLSLSRQCLVLGLCPRSILCCLQQANFFSLPGSGSSEKRKKYAERRILGFGMEQMFDVVQDIENYQNFLPMCNTSVVNSRKNNHVSADLTVGIPPIVESYTSSVTLIRPTLIKAESTKGKLFNELVFIWKFHPGLKGKPRSCVVDYNVHLEFRSAVASQIANVFFNEVVHAMTEAFYNEAKRRYGQESVPSRKIEVVSGNSSNSGSNTRKT